MWTAVSGPARSPWRSGTSGEGAPLYRGVGFASLTYGQKATSDPAQVYTAVFGAASLGLVMFGFIVGIEAIAMRNRPREAVA